MIGKRLKLARSAEGLSLRALQAKIGNRVTAQAIGKYERNEALPGSGVLIALADALEVSFDYLMGDQNMVLEGIDFRRKRITSKKELARVQAKALHLIERYLMVEEVLGLPSAEWHKPREAPFPVHELADADRAAQYMREHWNLGIDPIPNLVELLEERGIKVLIVDSEENIDGLAAQVRRSRGEPVRIIVIRLGLAGERQRFSLAHELGHMAMEVAPDERLRERAAHRFAGAFLMPAEAMWSNVGRRRSSIGWSELLALKQLFGASIQAIIYRCGDLGIFPPSLSQRLFQEYSRLGFRSAPDYEPNHLAEEKPGRFDRLCYRALAEGAISEPKAAELLNVPVRELNRRMQEPAPIAGQ
ncbi:MAG: ImmA/IrrE family metallo-endopeptidase [Candidatus Solibacter usitatus]|nr:ImmA/IrrE family metallo-endopeptidase [Candidatus Solibacter usitatus]